MKLPFPDSVLSQHTIALGKTRAGKSSKMRLIVEHLLDRELPVCIIDPKGDWWGLKSSADGRRPGFPIVIFGGEHADVPLNPAAGAAVAELIATGNRPSLLDLGSWMVGERTRFFIDFASTFFRFTRGRRYLVIDEVHNFAPKGKILDPAAGKMLHWANRLASEGAGKGAILVAASQRPQKVHNDFLTSCETLIACRVIHKADRDAIKDWIDGCADPNVGREVLQQLATMERPEAWVWSPEAGFGPTRVTFPLFRTYDSFKPQEANTGRLKGWAEVDLDEVREKLQTVVAEAEANDPKHLRARIAELEREARKPRDLAVDVQALEEAERRGFGEGRRQGFDTGAQSGLRAAHAFLADAMRRHAGFVRGAIDQALRSAVDEFANSLPNIPLPEDACGAPSAHTKVHRAHANAAPANKGAAPPARARNGATVEKAMPRAMLTALAQHPDGLAKRQMLIHTGYRSSGPVSTCFAELAREGWVESSGSLLRITSAGLAALGPFDPLPTGAALREHLLAGDKCSTMEKAILRVLFDAYPAAATKGRILEASGYKSSGPVSSAFARLVALGYAVQSGRSELRASEDLFQ